MTPRIQLSRRAFLFASLSTTVSLTSCAATSSVHKVSVTQNDSPAREPETDPELQERYGPVEDGGHHIPAIPYQKMDRAYLRQRVADPTGEAPGTVVVDTPKRFLYLVEPGGTAMRYGVGIGRDGFAWEGEGVIHWRQPWPRWKPPGEMIARQPHLAQYSVANGGMEPGIQNPLGARALYIFKNNEDTLYRLHGTPEWTSIGKAMSSGCVRLLNQDVIDLYDRVPYHARIVVHQLPSESTASNSHRTAPVAVG